MKLSNLKALRKKHKLTGKDLANVLNISYPQIYNYENGKNEPTIEMIVALAKYFNCSTDYLLGLTDIENPAEFYRDNTLELIKKSIEKL